MQLEAVYLKALLYMDIIHEKFHKTNSVRCYLLVKLGKSFVQIGSLTKSSWVKTFNLQKGFASHIGNLEEANKILIGECCIPRPRHSDRIS